MRQLLGRYANGLVIGRTLPVAPVLLTVLLSVGCRFTTPDGRALDLHAYDSIRVEQVECAPGITETQLGPLLEGYIQVAALESEKWKLAEELDLDRFAKQLEAYATTPGSINGKPIEPFMTREEFLEEHAEVHERWEAKLEEPEGIHPVSLKILITDLRFPHTLEGIAVGTQPRMRCTVDVYADGKLLGSGEMEAISGIPGIPFLPGSMVGRAAKSLVFDEFTRRTVLKLTAELAEETLTALEATK